MAKRAEQVVVFVVVLLIPAAGRIAADAVWPFVRGLDPDNAFLWITLHHVAQLGLTLLALAVVFRMPQREAGFNLDNASTSLKSCVVFALVYALWVVGRNLTLDSAPAFPYPLTARNMTGVLSFQMLLSGGAEEPLYRGLVMGVLGRHWIRVYRIGRVEMPLTGLIATALFMLGHVTPTSDPPYISYSGYQQFLAFSLGLFYAWQFHRTKSLLGPVIAHGCSNVIAVGSQYLMVIP